MQPSAIDLDQLNRYTGGDVALNAEILRLFRDQTSGLIAGLPAILDQGNGHAWHEVMHTLKGAARGVGAFKMADAAAAAESLQPESDHEKASEALALLRERADAVMVFIDSQLD